MDSALYRRDRNSIANHLDKPTLLPVSEITTAMCAPLLAKVECKGPDMERKVRQPLRASFDYAIELELLHSNPLPDVRPRRLARKHFTAVLYAHGVGVILRAADAAEISRGVRRAHLLAVFTGQRIGERFQLSGVSSTGRPERTIPRTRMKLKEEGRGDHIVPLPPDFLHSFKNGGRATTARIESNTPKTEGVA